MIIITNSAKFYTEGVRNKKMKTKDLSSVSRATWQKEDEGFAESINISPTGHVIG